MNQFLQLVDGRETLLAVDIRISTADIFFVRWTMSTLQDLECIKLPIWLADRTGCQYHSVRP
jgi:hypothetical protein